MKKKDLTDEILYRMEDELSTKQLETLKYTMQNVLYRDDKKYYEMCNKTNMDFYDDFYRKKTFENLSPKTLRSYSFVIKKFLNTIDKSCLDVTRDDAYLYLKRYKKSNNPSAKTLNNTRRYLLSFYNYLYQEGLVKRNPFRQINSIKEPKVIKKALTPTEIEIVRDHMKDIRDRAIFEVLYSTGIRVSELCSLNRADLINGSAVIKGKGNKERYVYFSESCMYYVNKYLNTRIDKHKALFIGKRKIYSKKKGKLVNRRITVGSIEKMFVKYSEKFNVKLYPHKFRRTLISKSLDRGMPLQEVQIIAGHSSPNTTMTYADLNQNIIKYDFLRNIG